MIPSLAQLSLVQRTRPGVGDPASGGPYKPQRSSWDFVIDGVSLYEPAATGRDLVSVIWTEPPVPQERVQAIRRLLTAEPGDASDGRVSLYVCPECGDLGCGAISVRIDGTPGEIVWRDFGFENNYEDSVERAAFASLGPFRFDRLAYAAQLEVLLPR
jgi:hypothetical protein